ncbi:hypothetical protein NEOLI_000560 [Neolecta irregularis DAH-3]|uniref:Uncharacterized protein n=1 Tax=Neolecta irregularis (strain DAH-3) TaxID=1198029 RepID=A0A1U7LKE8_NEOID|nr:hypothetical protein NEOLI_000560 [Neolecta irregularis DAH-3]|eukprot:OLL23136.1 hypothetical protein NEOLI_000560 [Neolecta irregularis DAH-3]
MAYYCVADFEMLSAKGSRESLHSISLESDPSDISSLNDEDYDVISKESLSANDISSSELDSSDEEDTAVNYHGLVYPLSQVGDDSVYSDQTLQMSLSAVSESIKSGSLCSSQQQVCFPGEMKTQSRPLDPIHAQDGIKAAGTMSSNITCVSDRGSEISYVINPDQAIQILYVGNLKYLYSIISKIHSSLWEFQSAYYDKKMLMRGDDQRINVIVLTNFLKEPQAGFVEESGLRPAVHIVKGFLLPGPRDKLNIDSEINMGEDPPSSTTSIPSVFPSENFVPDLIIVTNEAQDFSMAIRERILGFAYDSSVPLLYIGETPLSFQSSLSDIATDQFVTFNAPIKNNLNGNGGCKKIQSCITLENFQNLDAVDFGQRLTYAIGKNKNKQNEKMSAKMAATRRTMSKIILALVLVILLLVNVEKFLREFQGPASLKPPASPVIEDAIEYQPTLVFHQENSAIIMDCPKEVPICALQKLKTIWLRNDEIIHNRDIEPVTHPLIWKFIIPEEWKRGILRFKTDSQFAPFIRGDITIDFRQFEADKKSRDSKLTEVSTLDVIETNVNEPQRGLEDQKVEMNEQSIKQQAEAWGPYRSFVDQVFSSVGDHRELNIDIFAPQRLLNSVKGFASRRKLFERVSNGSNLDFLPDEIEKILKVASKQVSLTLHDLENAVKELDHKYSSASMLARYPVELAKGLHLSENTRKAWNNILMVERENLKIAQRQALFLKKKLFRKLETRVQKIRNRGKKNL